MMSRKPLALCVVAGWALILAMAPSASAATEFHASKTGKLQGLALNSQKLKLNLGTIECSGAATSGTVSKLLAATQLITVEYTGCTAFGLAMAVSLAQYVLDATNGTVAVENNIVLTIPAANCSIKMGPVGNGTLKMITYKNSGGKIIEESAVTGITYTSTGGTCGTGGSNGAFTGTNDFELVGGTIGWA